VVVINHQAFAQTFTYEPYFDNIIQHCFNHVEQILAGQNPVKDLVKDKLIPRHFENMTCTDVSNEKLHNTEFSDPQP
jgi:hypothetical protein